jgi:hypothetical protein
VQYQRNPDFIYRKIVDEAVLVPIHQDVANMDCIYTLNEVAAFIWEAVEQPTFKDALVDALLLEYDADPDVLEADLTHFLSEMKAVGALQEVEK